MKTEKEIRLQIAEKEGQQEALKDWLSTETDERRIQKLTKQLKTVETKLNTLRWVLFG